jgi:uncharacterized damage-inducible protein DinB
MRRVGLLVAVIAASAVGLAAQGAGAAGPLSEAIQQGWKGARGNLKASAELMPEDGYAFRPVDTVRTFGQILAHVAGANYVFCAAARGEQPPHAEDEFEKTAKTRAEIIKALDDSLAYCDLAYSALTDAHAADMVAMPFGMGQGPRASALMSNTGHLEEHYGNLVTYFRIKGIVPPSSRR